MVVNLLATGLLKFINCVICFRRFDTEWLYHDPYNIAMKFKWYAIV